MCNGGRFTWSLSNQISTCGTKDFQGCIQAAKAAKYCEANRLPQAKFSSRCLLRAIIQGELELNQVLKHISPQHAKVCCRSLPSVSYAPLPQRMRWFRRTNGKWLLHAATEQLLAAADVIDDCASIFLSSLCLCHSPDGGALVYPSKGLSSNNFLSHQGDLALCPKARNAAVTQEAGRLCPTARMLQPEPSQVCSHLRRYSNTQTVPVFTSVRCSGHASRVRLLDTLDSVTWSLVLQLTEV